MGANERQVGGAHYKEAVYQHWDFAADNRLGYFEGQVTKYITRWRRKNGVQDLEKALHFTDKLYEVVTQGTVATRAGFHMLNFTQFAVSNSLGSLEARIISLVCCYQSPSELLTVRNLIRQLIEAAQTEAALTS